MDGDVARVLVVVDPDVLAGAAKKRCTAPLPLTVGVTLLSLRRSGPGTPLDDVASCVHHGFRMFASIEGGTRACRTCE